MNPSIQLTRELRNAVRTIITAQPGWQAWREEHLDGRSAADMRRAEILQAANALHVDIAAIASTLAANPSTFTPSTQQDTDTMETAPASLTARDDAAALAHAIATAPAVF